MQEIKRETICLSDKNDSVFMNVMCALDNTQEGGMPAMIICPGGGYLCIGEAEGSPVAERFFAEGYNTFVLNYSINGDAKFDENSPESFAPVVDLKNAVDYIIDNAAQLNVNKDKICVAAFSAGGHLSTRYVLQENDSHEKIKALILVYPMQDFRYKIGPAKDFEDVFQSDLFKMVSNQIFGEFPPNDSVIQEFSNHVYLKAMDIQNPDNLPPIFIYHAENDRIVSFMSTVYFVAIMKEKGVHFDSYLTKDGEHANPFYDPTWFENAIEWLGNKLAAPK